MWAFDCRDQQRCILDTTTVWNAKGSDGPGCSMPLGLVEWIIEDDLDEHMSILVPSDGLCAEQPRLMFFPAQLLIDLDLIVKIYWNKILAAVRHPIRTRLPFVVKNGFGTSSAPDLPRHKFQSYALDYFLLAPMIHAPLDLATVSSNLRVLQSKLRAARSCAGTSRGAQLLRDGEDTESGLLLLPSPPAPFCDSDARRGCEHPSLVPSFDDWNARARA